MPELIVIFVVVLLLFGSQRLPDLARGLGKGIREFKKAANDIKSELDSAPIKKEMREIEGDIKKDLQD
jgi:sec-independent protein translocase protein TatA